MSFSNFIFYSAKVSAEFIRDVLYFPVWWYGRGLINLLSALRNFLADKEKSLALSIWMKNIFRPMYGQYDWAGIIISFFVRLFQIIVRSAAMIFWLIVALAILILWLDLPVLAIYEIWWQLM
ncbi:hypothetical protein HY798_01370 [Candidatus Falkowbacteria bacterium]|nr:hypothetical protein [Candidatus Falkowbacteria bacterium]